MSGNSGAILIQAQPTDPGKTGSVTNSGTVTGAVSFFGLASANLTNSGSIATVAGSAIRGNSPLTVTNAATGTITGATSGMTLDGTSLAINNAGTVRGNGNSSEFFAPNGGILWTGGAAQIINSGTISGQKFGVSSFYYFNPATGQQEGRAIGSTVQNSGSIIGDGEDGVRLIGGGVVTNSGYIAGRLGGGADGVSMFAFDDQPLASFIQIGSVTNLAGGVIDGNRFGVILSGGGSVNNAGTTSGSSGSVVIQAQPSDPGRVGTLNNSGTLNGQVGFFSLASASLTNSGSIINAGSVAVQSNSQIDLVNSGTITGSGPIAVQFGSFNDSATLATGSAINGAVDGSDGYDRAVLDGSLTTASSLQAVPLFLNFEELTVSGGYWTAAGAAGAFSAIGIDAGTLHLTGSLEGDVTIGADGAFIIGDGGTIGTFGGDLVNDGQFTVNRSDDFDFAGNFSGTGNFTKLGAGTLTFTGSYGFSGTTSLLAGGLVIGGALDPATSFTLTGGTLQLTGNQTIAGLSGTGGELVLNGGGVLLIDQAEDTAYSGSISGTGSITKEGSGLLNLTGSSDYTGSTTVNGGVLAVNGSITSDVTVNTGATLGGTGTTGNVTLNGGVFNPGNSIGTIAVSGSLRFGSGSTFQVEVAPSGDSDRINVSGQVTIDPTASVQVLAGSGSYKASTSYTILTTSEAIQGKFGSVTSNLAFLTPKLAHKSNSVTLIMVRNSRSFASAGTAIQASTAGAVESLGTSNLVYQAVIEQSLAGARQAFGALSGSTYIDLGSGLAGSSGEFELVPLVAGSVTPTLRWHSSKRSNDRYSGALLRLDQSRFMVVAGIQDGPIALGALRGDVTTRFVNTAAAHRLGRLQIGAELGQSWHEIYAARTINFPSYSEVAQARTRIQTRQLKGEVSYALSGGDFALAPYAAYSMNNIRSGGFRETGGAAALRFDRSDRLIHSISSGVRASTTMGLGDSITASPRLGAALVRRWGDLDRGMTASFANGSPAFEGIGQPLNSTSAEIDAGLDLSFGRFSLKSGYRGEFGAERADHSARAVATLRF